MKEPKYFIGDHVYPTSEDDIEVICRELVDGGEPDDAINIYGVVVDVDNGDYAVRWLSISMGKPRLFFTDLRDAWWEETELTDNQQEFLNKFHEIFIESYAEDEE